MKKILLILSAIAFGYLCFDNGAIKQPTQAPLPPSEIPAEEFYGAWGYANIEATNIVDLYNGYNVNGIHLTVRAAQIRPSSGSYDWALFDDRVTTLANLGYYIGIHPVWGPDASPYMLNGSLVDTFYTLRDEVPDGPYPDYFDADYKAYYFETQRAIIAHIATLPSAVRDKIVYYQISEGSTGDGEPYKGFPWNIADTIGELRWSFTFKYPAWDSITGYLSTTLPWVHPLINTNNDGLHLSYVMDRFGSFIMVKEGTLSHDIGFDAEYEYYIRNTPASRGEAQGYMIRTIGSQNKCKEGFALICSALSGGLNIINLPQAWMNGVHEADRTNADPRLIDFFNKYVNAGSKRGFIIPADRPDFADTIRFPTGVYGTIAKVGDSTDGLNKRLYNLKDSNYSNEFRLYRSVKVTAKFMSTSRVNAIRAEFPLLSFNKREADDPAGDHANSYNDDYTVGGVPYYHRNITLVNPYTNIEGGGRVGPDSSMVGRWAARVLAGKSMYFDVPNNMKVTPKSDVVDITVTYFNAGSGTVKVNTYSCGEKLQQSIALTNTNQWKTVTVRVNGLNFRQNGWDFSISGTPTWIGLVEFDNISKP